ncbi:GntR family transcriptional regulator [Microterricola viridarii]|uniref:GntR family transcriptional regulator n=1 Tax=Microterricola viridarii TaxID=412690 RepID=UPI0009EB031A|nr:GntR family transcriptional regulator [Microterricola viridarii]
MEQQPSSTPSAATGAHGEARPEGVYRALLRSIIAGDAAPGSRLKERELSERYAVSRIPIRQALQRLESEGFVLAEPRRGAVVKPMTRHDVEELFDARLCIEPFATRHAALRLAAGIESADRLTAILAEARSRFADGDDVEGISSNLGFHAEVVRLSGNGLLVRSLQPMLGRMEWVFRLTHGAREGEQAGEHQQLYEALLQGNAELAAAQAYAHIERGRVPTLAALAPFLTR